MHIHQANISNLISLWKEYGAYTASQSNAASLYSNTHWPHRCWFEWGSLPEQEIFQALQSSAGINTLIDSAPQSAILPVFPDPLTLWVPTPSSLNGVYGQLIEQQLTTNKWVCAFEQTAMFLALRKDKKYQTSVNKGIKIRPVETPAGVKSWINIASEAFDYRIDQTVIEALIDKDDIKLLLAYKNGEPAASGLLYKTDEVIGIHQLGVAKTFQRQGIARQFMLEIIAACYQWQGKYMVLQASPIGLPLYQQLGFTTQFLIKNYQRLS